MTDLFPGIPHVITECNGRRVRDGKPMSWPLAIYWGPSRSLVGGWLTIHPRGEYPSQYCVVGGQARDGSLFWWLRRYDTKAKYVVSRESLRYSCDCQGFAAHGHCRHADAVAHLDTEGFFQIVRGSYIV